MQGNNHTFVVITFRNNGSVPVVLIILCSLIIFFVVWSCGRNVYGELGLGHITTTYTPEKVVNLPPIISISAGHHFSLFLDANGCIWSCGDNGSGRLGLGDQNPRRTPEQIKKLPKIISAIALKNSSIFLDCEGSVWSCGKNEYGNLGLGDSRSRNAPQKIEGLPKIKAIAGGQSHTLFLDYEGSVWSCGCASAGRLGLNLVSTTQSRNKPTKLTKLSGNIKFIAAGGAFSLFVNEEGSVWVCGENVRGQLGMGHLDRVNTLQKNNHLSGIVAAAAGMDSSIFLDNQGNVFVCGANGSGQLGVDEKNLKHTPQKVVNIPPISSLCLSSPIGNHFQLVDCEGRVWSSGSNTCGQLGMGDTNDRRTFQIIESLPKLKSNQGITPGAEIFKLLEKEQSKELREKFVNCRNKFEKEEVKEMMLLGTIGMPDWSSKWLPIHERNQKLTVLIQNYKLALFTKQQQASKLAQEINETQQALSKFEEEKETLDFYDALLQPMAEVEKELKSGFEEKLKAGKYREFTVDEVSLFLNICGIEEQICQQREKKMNGEVLGVAVCDVTVMEFKDRLAKRKFEFYLKVLDSGKMMMEEALGKSMVWRHREVEKTLLLP